MTVLFLCVANSARSQMAEGLGRALAPDGVIVLSAGSVPTSVRPEAIQAMAEVDIDISHHTSTGVDEVALEDVDVVVTLCAEEECPIFPGEVTRISWAMPDPAAAPDGQRLQAFRDARDAIRTRLEAFYDAP